jgi:hypothetical protein
MTCVSTIDDYPWNAGNFLPEQLVEEFSSAVLNSSQFSVTSDTWPYNTVAFSSIDLSNFLAGELTFGPTRSPLFILQNGPTWNFMFETARGSFFE